MNIIDRRYKIHVVNLVAIYVIEESKYFLILSVVASITFFVESASNLCHQLIKFISSIN